MQLYILISCMDSGEKCQTRGYFDNLVKEANIKLCG